MTAIRPELKLHNTRTHRIDAFRTQQPGVARMYVCGPSVYDESHLGHARSYVVYDALKRVLKAWGLRVVHAQNFTDVEENVSKRAEAAGLKPLELADHLIERFFEDMDALGVQRADHYPRVSENIAEIQRIVGDLMEKRIAYKVDCGPRTHVAGACDVYFRVQKASDFGSLVGTNVEELAVERPVHAGDRKHPLDFALWKSRDDWGMTWESPWGAGRPGWHVECTAMSIKHLGAHFDIHGGGLDLVFPHHESERAIGEAWTGTEYCEHYVHNGFVTVQGGKMSKSLGNFVTIKDLLAKHDPEVLRTFLLSVHYRAPLNYDERAIREAAERVARWRDGLRDLHAAAAEHGPAAAPPTAVRVALDKFWAALADDLRFDGALAALDEAIHAARDARGPDAAATIDALREAARTLGLVWVAEKPN